MSENPYREIASDREAALRGIRPEVANRPLPESFSIGVHDGKSAAISREVRNTNEPRKE
jgi:hypothetical protein